MSASVPFTGGLEGPAKVTSSLFYEGDVLPPGTSHAALVEAQIARGRVVSITRLPRTRCRASRTCLPLVTRRICVPRRTPR